MLCHLLTPTLEWELEKYGPWAESDLGPLFCRVVELRTVHIFKEFLKYCTRGEEGERRKGEELTELMGPTKPKLFIVW